MRAILLTLERWGALARKNDEHKGGWGAAITISCTGTDDGKDEKEAEGFRTEVLFQKDPDKLRPANSIPPPQPELNWLAVPGVVRRFKVRPLPSILAVCVQQTAPSVVEPLLGSWETRRIQFQTVCTLSVVPQVASGRARTGDGGGVGDSEACLRTGNSSQQNSGSGEEADGAVEYAVESEAFRARALLQNLVDTNGCRRVMAS